MSATNWAPEADSLRIQKRAKGRDRYNAWRGAVADWRRFEAGKLLGEVGYPLRRGWQSRLARRLGVNRSTICRDFAPYKKLAPYSTAIAKYEMLGQPLIAEVLRLEMQFEIDEFEECRRLGWRLDRRRRLGLRW